LAAKKGGEQKSVAAVEEWSDANEKALVEMYNFNPSR